MGSKQFVKCLIASVRWFPRLKNTQFFTYTYTRKCISYVKPLQVTALAISFPVIASCSSTNNYSTTNIESELIKSSDELFDEGRFEESYKVISSLKNTENVEVLWRLSRGLFNMKNEENITEEAVKALIFEADEYIEKAMKLNSKHFAVHKWFAIILDAKKNLEGSKARLAALPTFKHHIEQAIELNPQDATSMHMLGSYYYNLSNLPYYQKKIAEALYGAFPAASFQEALDSFKKAEETSPNFYSVNLLMLGKTYLKLGKKDSAKIWLQKASVYLVKTKEDKAVQKEALELLKKLH